jgi:DNA-directed RNA polymerase subunit F
MPGLTMMDKKLKSKYGKLTASFEMPLDDFVEILGDNGSIETLNDAMSDMEDEDYAITKLCYFPKVLTQMISEDYWEYFMNHEDDIGKIVAETCSFNINFMKDILDFQNYESAFYMIDMVEYICQMSKYDMEEISSLYDDLVELFQFWRDVAIAYCKIRYAKAKAVIVKALYNPHTKLGKIHHKYLYNEFIDE